MMEYKGYSPREIMAMTFKQITNYTERLGKQGAKQAQEAMLQKMLAGQGGGARAQRVM